MGAYCVSPDSALGARKVLVNKKQQNPDVNRGDDSLVWEERWFHGMLRGQKCGRK